MRPLRLCRAAAIEPVERDLARRARRARASTRRAPRSLRTSTAMERTAAGSRPASAASDLETTTEVSPESKTTNMWPARGRRDAVDDDAVGGHRDVLDRIAIPSEVDQW